MAHEILVKNFIFRDIYMFIYSNVSTKKIEFAPSKASKQQTAFFLNIVTNNNSNREKACFFHFFFFSNSIPRFIKLLFSTVYLSIIRRTSLKLSGTKNKWRYEHSTQRQIQQQDASVGSMECRECGYQLTDKPPNVL